MLSADGTARVDVEYSENMYRVKRSPRLNLQRDRSRMMIPAAAIKSTQGSTSPSSGAVFGEKDVDGRAESSYGP
jgi:hypothetical protein